MKNISVSLFFVVIFLFSFGQVFATGNNGDNFSEEGNVVDQTGNVSNGGFDEESTAVDQTGDNIDSSFEEESTVVDQTGNNSDGGFDEESTVVGDPDQTTIITPTNTPGGSSSGGSGGSRKAKVGTFASSIGEYSTATGTCQILTNHMKRGMNNNVMEVIVLQAFLNKEMGTNLPLTGFFGPLTEQAVKDFQVKYANDILKPWFDLSLSKDAVTPTGYVYKTTLYKINSILCEGIKLEAPVLN